ncbi:MAG: allophanate hydrolase, partial [Sphingomonadales bacterium]|nr:allophanate hydrolase [Sphingomonadales bacterium]
AAADLARLAQMPVGAELRFEAISREAGEDLWRTQRAALRALIAGLVPKPEGALSSDYLLSCDLVGGVFDPAAVTGTDLTAGES